METRTKYLFIILIVGSLLFLSNLGGRDLWGPDETRYAVVAREMVQSGDWILPHLNRDIYGEKLPLFFWLVNLSTFLRGANSELANRLPSALAGLMTLFVTFGLFYLHLSLILPKFNPERSMKTFSERILRRMGPEEELKMAFFGCHGLLYYTQKPYIEEIKSGDRFSQVLHSPQRVRVVIPLRYFDVMKRKLNLERGSIEQVRAGPHDLVLFSNR